MKYCVLVFVMLGACVQGASDTPNTHEVTDASSHEETTNHDSGEVSHNVATDAAAEETPDAKTENKKDAALPSVEAEDASIILVPFDTDAAIAAISDAETDSIEDAAVTTDAETDAAIDAAVDIDATLPLVICMGGEVCTAYPGNGYKACMMVGQIVPPKCMGLATACGPSGGVCMGGAQFDDSHQLYCVRKCE